jgi:hypothetical protein
MNDDAAHKIDTTERTTEIVITKKIKTDHQPQTVKSKSQYHDFECTKENIDDEINRLRIDEIGLKLFKKYLYGELTSIWGKRQRADLSEEERGRCRDKLMKKFMDGVALELHLRNLKSICSVESLSLQMVWTQT